MRLMRFGFNGGGFVFNDIVAADTTSYNLASRATSAGWDGVLALIATVTINAGVRLTAAGTNLSTFDASGPFPAGSSLALVLQSGARIYGRGGDGGAGGIGPGGAASSGGSGGVGLSVGLPTSVNNDGTIAGGGGGGGGGGAGTLITSQWGRGGGGGGGAPGGTGYPAQAATGSTGSAGAGGNATETTGGAGGGGSVQGGQGGAGGGLGVAGGNGTTGTGGSSTAGAAGGAAGAAVVGNSNINWIATGTRLGAIT